jgi:hypothetical protein
MEQIQPNTLVLRGIKCLSLPPSLSPSLSLALRVHTGYEFVEQIQPDTLICMYVCKYVYHILYICVYQDM